MNSHEDSSNLTTQRCYEPPHLYVSAVSRDHRGTYHTGVVYLHVINHETYIVSIAYESGERWGVGIVCLTTAHVSGTPLAYLRQWCLLCVPSRQCYFRPFDFLLLNKTYTGMPNDESSIFSDFNINKICPPTYFNDYSIDYCSIRIDPQKWFVSFSL